MESPENGSIARGDGDVSLERNQERSWGLARMGDILIGIALWQVALVKARGY
jgi:hypothetical protein